MIIKASTKKVYAIESTPTFRILASGLKMTDRVMELLGAKVSDNVNYAHDDETGEVYIFKAEDGNKIGKTKTFTNTGLKAKLLILAGLPGNDEVKGGKQVIFDVSETPIDSDGTKLFKLTFDKIEESTDEEGAIESAPKAKATSSVEEM
jgi:hypothetical protein